MHYSQLLTKSDIKVLKYNKLCKNIWKFYNKLTLLFKMSQWLEKYSWYMDTNAMSPIKSVECIKKYWTPSSLPQGKSCLFISVQLVWFCCVGHPLSRGPNKKYSRWHRMLKLSHYKNYFVTHCVSNVGANKYTYFQTVINSIFT